MKTKYLMGNSDGLQRSPSEKIEKTTVTDTLRINLISSAIDKAIKFFTDFFDIPFEIGSTRELALEYDKVFTEAKNLLLIEPGGIREKDHLNLWCLGKVLQPKQYVESGVFIGSSLHALIRSVNIETITGIDPNLKSLRVPSHQLQGANMIDDKDFSEIEFPDIHFPNLVYFDDHINAARRIVEAHEKGFTYLLFDDATGFEGICQRLYPAIPTIPMIMNPTLFTVGDILSWSFKLPSKESSNKKNKRFFRSESPTKRVKLEITQDFISLCKEASVLIHRVEKLPELGDFIFQEWPEKSVDTTKFLIKLID